MHLTQLFTKLDTLIPSLLSGDREVTSVWLNDALNYIEVCLKGEEGTSSIFFDESCIYYPLSLCFCFEEDFVVYSWEEVIEHAPQTESVILEIKQELKDNNIVIYSEVASGFLKWW